MSQVSSKAQFLSEEKEDQFKPPTFESRRSISIDNGDAHIENETGALKLGLVTIGLCFSNLLCGLDFTLLATAIPVITSHFSSLNDVGWYGSAYFIAMCVGQPLSGKLYLIFPKKTVYLIYIAVFEIGSLVCALSPSSLALIVGRAVSGLGASGIFSGSFIIIATIAPLHKRATLNGAINAAFGASQIIGPLIGGAFTQRVSWRWCFYINLPIGGLAAALIMIFFRTKSEEPESYSLLSRLERFDVVGFIVFAGSIIMLALALQWGGSTFVWNSPVIIGLFVGFGLSFVLFCIRQWYMNDHALVPPRVFHQRTVILAILTALAANGGFQTIIYYLPIWFQAVLGATPLSSGIRYLPSVISDVLASIVGGVVVAMFGWYNPFFIFGVGILSVGSGLLTTLYPTISEGRWIGFQILCGSGYSFLAAMPHIAMQAVLPPDLIPIASTTLLFAMTAGDAVLLAVAQAVFQSSLQNELSKVVSPDQVDTIVAAGAAMVRDVADLDTLDAVVLAYNRAVTNVFFIPAVGTAVAFFFVCGMEWKNIKVRNLQRRGSECA